MACPARRDASAPVVLLLALLLSSTASAATFTVDRTDDDATAMACTTDPNDCSLRGAVRAANANVSLFDIIVIPDGVYELTIPGANEDNAITGDLDLRGTVFIQAAPGSHPVIVQTVEDRVFHTALSFGAGTVNVVLQGPMTLAGGTVPDIQDDGGSIAFVQTGNLVLTDVTLLGGEAGDDGGCLYYVNPPTPGASLVLTDVVVSGCRAGDDGGGLAAQLIDADATLTRVLVEANEADSGGGGWLYGSVNARIEDSTIRANTAGAALAEGGGLYLAQVTGSIVRSTVAGNRAGVPGSTNGAGGGIHLESSSLQIENSTISGNRTTGSSFAPGNAFDLSNSQATVLFSTIVGDPGAFYDSIRIYTGSSLELTSSIVHGRCFTAGTATSLGYNVEKPVDGSVASTCGLTDPSDLFTTASLLLPLAGYGGPTPTHALRDDALGLLPAVPSTVCDDPLGGAIDQRSAPRGGLSCEPGSFEHGAQAPGPWIFSDGFDSASAGAWTAAVPEP